MSVGAVLLLRERRSLQVLGVLTAAVGVATAPVLLVPVAVVAGGAARKRTSTMVRMAVVLGAAAGVALVLAVDGPTPVTSTVLDTDRLLLVLTAAVAGCCAVLIPGLRVLAAVLGALLLLVVPSCSGADLAVPALVVAVMVTGAVLLHDLAGRIAARPPQVRRAAAALGALSAAAGVVVVAAVVVPDLQAPRPDEPPRPDRSARHRLRSTPPPQR
jgi:hypothetical protein